MCLKSNTNGDGGSAYVCVRHGLLMVKFKRRVDTESSGKAGLFHRKQSKDKWGENSG